jgi:ABC-2 type transport system permease protein
MSSSRSPDVTCAMIDRSFVGRPIVQLTLVRLREFLREPEAVFWTTLFPVLLTTGLGLAFRSRPEPLLKVAAAPSVARALKSEPGLEVLELAPQAAREALRLGHVTLVAELGEHGEAILRYDDTNPDGRAARALADRAIQRAAGRVDPVPIRDQLTRDPGARYVDFLVPGLVGLGIMSNAVWGLGFAIVDSRRRRLLKRLLVTPMSRSQYLASFLIWRLMLLPVEVMIPIVFGAVAFGVPIRGASRDIGFICLLASLCFSAMGTLVASRVRSIEGLSGLVNLVIVPMWIVSGVFFSSQRFPEWAQPLIKVLPLTAFIDALRAIQLQGARLGEVWSEIATLTVWLVVTFVAALKLFRWR